MKAIAYSQALFNSMQTYLTCMSKVNQAITLRLIGLIVIV